MQAGPAGTSRCPHILYMPKDFLAWKLHGKTLGSRQGHVPPFFSLLLTHSVKLAKSLSPLDLGFLTCNKDREYSHQGCIHSLLAPAFYSLIFATFLGRVGSSQASDYLTLSFLCHTCQAHFSRQVHSKEKYRGSSHMLLSICWHDYDNSDFNSLQSIFPCEIHRHNCLNNTVRWE